MSVRWTGQVTVFGALLFLIVFSVLAAQYESALYYMQQVSGKRAARISCESLLAAYNRPLRDYYHILAIDGGRGTDNFDAVGLENELVKGFRENLSWIPGTKGSKIEIAEPFFTLLVDHDWDLFLREIRLDRKEVAFNHIWEEITAQWIGANRETSEDLQRQQAAVENNSPEDSKEGGEKVPVADPRDFIMEIWNQGILAAACPKGFILSDKTCSMTEVSFPEAGNRFSEKLDLKDDQNIASILTQWEGMADEGGGIEKTAEDMAVGTYIGDTFANASISEKDFEFSKVLDYEMEYILGGNETDSENLKSTLWKLIALRCGMNMTHLLMDPEKCGQVEGTALTLSGALLVPQFAPVVGFLLKVTWAFAESLADCRTLLRGGRIPVLKNRRTWYLSWDQMLHMQGDLLDGNHGDEGLNYEQYLQFFLLTMKRETKYRRMTHLMEKNIRQISGYEQFYMKNCIYGLWTTFDWQWRDRKHSRVSVGLSY